MPLPRSLRSAVAVSRRPIITTRRISAPSLPYSQASAPQTKAYLDYARYLTPEGGVLILYKDIDTRCRWWAWRTFAWSLATGFDTWIAFYQSPLEGIWLNGFCWLAAAILNGLIVWPAIAVRRQLEIRPDCLILEGREVFWRHFMEGGHPCFQPIEDDPDAFSFRGVYGTRLVEYGVLRRFDDNDRQPETFAAHIQQAIEQLWNK